MDHSNRFGNGVESILANYKLGKTLGIGSFGKVKIAEHVVTGHKVAIIILNRRKIKNMEMEEKVRREIKILRLFMHPHIIRQYEVIDTPSDIYVVMEYVKSGELFDYIVEKGRLQEDEARNFFQQIVSGVEYCHHNMVVHRDLKPENLLLDSRCNIKIADFGLSNVMRDGHFLKTSCGSPNYADPEVISGKLYAGPEVDVWSCGVILYALLCGTLPFDDENIPNLFKKIKGGIYTLPSHLSSEARDLIPRMLIVDPVKRITIPEIRQHRWFQTHLLRYLAVSPPDTVEQINEEIIQEVVNMGFDRNQVMESLRYRIQNDATVTYYMLLDNRFRVPSGYLESEFQETTDRGSNPMCPAEAAASPVGHWVPGVPAHMDHYGLGARSQVLADRKWALGLQNGKQMVQERALTALASFPDSSQEHSQKYYDAVMPYLKTILMNATDKSKRMLCAKSMECISLVGMAVGKDRFRDDARQLMEVLMSLQGSQMEANDLITSYMLQTCARLCKCLGQDFLPYMSVVMPPLLQSAQLKPDVTITSADSEDEAEDSDDESMETIILGDKRIGIKTSGLDADELKEGFFPWIDQVAPTLVPLLKFYFHEEVGRAAVSALPELMRSAKLAIEKGESQGRDLSYSKQLSDYIIPAMLEALHKEPDTEICVSMLEAINECLQGRDKTAEERRIAICICDDVAEQCRDAAFKYYDTYLPFVLEACKVVHDQLCSMVERQDVEVLGTPTRNIAYLNYRVVPKMSDLPSDLEEEVLTRLPVTSLGKLRLTCKKWNTLTKGESFLKKQRKGIEMVMLLECRVSLMSVDLLYPSIERIGNLDADGVDISKVFHCNGLFLCITKDKDSSRLVVWNPYLGQTRWIEPSNSYHRWEKYALGYDKEENKHKVLRFVNDMSLSGSGKKICEFEMYRLNSNSWKVIDDFVPDWRISFKHSGLSLKGNTYWYAQEQIPLGYSGLISPDHPDFLLSFDFTTERFGPRLHLPFHAFFKDTVTLSSLREEQLVVLFRKRHTSVVKIWITNKIEPNAVSWNNLFLAVDMEPLIVTNLFISNFAGSFFVDEEKKVAVVFGKDRDASWCSRNIAYIIGNNRYLKKVVLGESLDNGCYAFVCSYVPSSLQIRNTP